MPNSLLTDEQILSGNKRTGSIIDSVLSGAVQMSTILAKRDQQDKQADAYNYSKIKEIVSDAKLKTNKYDVEALRSQKSQLEEITKNIYNPSPTTVNLTRAHYENLDRNIKATEMFNTNLDYFSTVMEDGMELSWSHYANDPNAKKNINATIKKIKGMEQAMRVADRMDATTARNIQLMIARGEDIKRDLGDDGVLTVSQARNFNAEAGLKEHTAEAKATVTFLQKEYNADNVRWKNLETKEMNYEATKHQKEDLTGSVLRKVYPELTDHEKTQLQLYRDGALDDKKKDLDAAINIWEQYQRDMYGKDWNKSTADSGLNDPLLDGDDDKKKQQLTIGEPKLRSLDFSKPFPTEIVSSDTSTSALALAMEEAETGSVSDDSTTTVGAKNSDGTYDLGSYQINQRWLLKSVGPNKSYELSKIDGKPDPLYAKVQDLMIQMVPGYDKMSNKKKQLSFLNLTKEEQWNIAKVVNERGIQQWATKDKILNILERNDPSLLGTTPPPKKTEFVHSDGTKFSTQAELDKYTKEQTTPPPQPKVLTEEEKRLQQLNLDEDEFQSSVYSPRPAKSKERKLQEWHLKSLTDDEFMRSYGVTKDEARAGQEEADAKLPKPEPKAEEYSIYSESRGQDLPTKAQVPHFQTQVNKLHSERKRKHAVLQDKKEEVTDKALSTLREINNWDGVEGNIPDEVFIEVTRAMVKEGGDLFVSNFGDEADKIVEHILEAKGGDALKKSKFGNNESLWKKHKKHLKSRVQSIIRPVMKVSKELAKIQKDYNKYDNMIIKYAEKKK